LNRRGLGGLPILALCCLLFILFLIASTIVLALIPVYIQPKEATRGMENIYQEKFFQVYSYL